MNDFSDQKDLKNVDVRSAKAEYDLAAELGLASKSQVSVLLNFLAEVSSE